MGYGVWNGRRSYGDGWNKENDVHNYSLSVMWEVRERRRKRGWIKLISIIIK